MQARTNYAVFFGDGKRAARAQLAVTAWSSSAGLSIEAIFRLRPFALVAVSVSVSTTISASWEEEAASSAARRRMCRRKVDISSCGPTSTVMWSDLIESSVSLMVLLAGSVGNGGANGSASVCKVGRGG